MADNTIHLLQAAAARRANALGSAREAISRLDRDGQEISFRRVAAEAGVSRSWLYREPAIRAEIEKLRATASTASPRVPSAQRASTDSLHQRLDAIHDELTRLRDENRALRDQLARRLGQQRHDGDMTTTTQPPAAKHFR